jgi:hypothetical protein
LKVKRTLYALANVPAGVVIILLLIDPVQPLTPVLWLLGIAVVLVALGLVWR